MIQIQNRAAVAMIELIFAIVIMGIVLLSAPMIISTATRSGYVALQQESIAAVSSEIGMILTHHWDESNTDENLSAPILITNGNSELNEAVNSLGDPTGRRAGTSRYSKRSFLTSLGGELNATLPSNFTDEGDFDDIDDFHTSTGNLYMEENTSTLEGDYVDRDINLDTNVSYINDAGTFSGSSLTFDFNTTTISDTTNIKMIKVVLTTDKNETEMEKDISLQAFSCNIGTYELEERTY